MTLCHSHMDTKTGAAWPKKKKKKKQLGMSAQQRLILDNRLFRCALNEKLMTQGISCGQRKLVWSVLVDAQADLNLRWRHKSNCSCFFGCYCFCFFCCCFFFFCFFFFLFVFVIFHAEGQIIAKVCPRYWSKHQTSREYDGSNRKRFLTGFDKK